MAQHHADHSAGRRGEVFYCPYMARLNYESNWLPKESNNRIKMHKACFSQLNTLYDKVECTFLDLRLK